HLLARGRGLQAGCQAVRSQKHLNQRDLTPCARRSGRPVRSRFETPRLKSGPASELRCQRAPFYDRPSPASSTREGGVAWQMDRKEPARASEVSGVGDAGLVRVLVLLAPDLAPVGSLELLRLVDEIFLLVSGHPVVRGARPGRAVHGWSSSPAALHARNGDNGAAPGLDYDPGVKTKKPGGRGPKSAFDLAMERLKAADEAAGEAVAPLDSGQKKAIADARQKATARLAEREILFRDVMRKTADPAEREKAEREYQIDRQRIQDECDRAIAAIRRR